MMVDTPPPPDTKQRRRRVKEIARFAFLISIFDSKTEKTPENQSRHRVPVSSRLSWSNSFYLLALVLSTCLCRFGSLVVSFGNEVAFDRLHNGFTLGRGLYTPVSSRLPSRHVTTPSLSRRRISFSNAWLCRCENVSLSPSLLWSFDLCGCTLDLHIPPLPHR